MITLSIIIPVYRGEKFIKQLIEQIDSVKKKWETDYAQLKIIESIFVIDGALDNSLNILNEQQRDWINIIELSKSFGQHPATVAGILHSSGDWVVTIDEDLQHNPEFIETLLKKVAFNSDDICYALATSSTHNSIIRDKFSILFKKMVSILAGEPNINKFNSFRLIRGSIARAAAAISTHESYYDIILCWFTDKIITHKIQMEDIRNREDQGPSGYSFFQLIKHGKRMIMTSKVNFLRLGIFVGIFAFSISIILSIYALYAKIFDPNIYFNKGWVSTIISIVFFGGLSSLLSGVMLESVSDILLTSKGKPTFFVVDRSSDKELKKILKE